jgi:GTP-binding protein
MEIFKAEFIKGIIGDDYGNLPQFVFLGRSNVGKSSVINSLTRRKKLVKTSKTPGKTRQANLYLINDSFSVIDFPGYGYAKFSIKERNKIIERICWYLENRKPLVVFLVIDIKVGLTSLDWEMIKFLEKNNHCFIALANKSDKLSSTQLKEKIDSIKQRMSVIVYSAKKNKGREELISEIEKCL